MCQLLRAKLYYDPQLLSSAVGLRNLRLIRKCKDLHEVGPSGCLSLHLDWEGAEMDDCFLDSLQAVWIHSYTVQAS